MEMEKEKLQVELSLFGQVLRLNCPKDQHEQLLLSAKRLEEVVGEMKGRSGIIQLDRVLSVVALNLQVELDREKAKNDAQRAVLESCLSQLSQSLSQVQTQSDISLSK